MHTRTHDNFLLLLNLKFTFMLYKIPVDTDKHNLCLILKLFFFV